MGENAPARLFTWRDRYQKLQKMNCAGLLQLKFNQDLANMDALDFIKTILVDTLKRFWLIP